MKLYISGPITGTLDYGHRFATAQRRLIAAGHDPYNPAAHALPPGKNSHADYMRRDFEVILTVEGLALLPGWHDSNGAQAELAMAKSIGLPVRAVEGWEQHHGAKTDPEGQALVEAILERKAKEQPRPELAKNPVAFRRDPELNDVIHNLDKIAAAHTTPLVDLTELRCVHTWTRVETLPPIKECADCGETRIIHA